MNAAAAAEVRAIGDTAMGRLPARSVWLDDRSMFFSTLFWCLSGLWNWKKTTQGMYYPPAV